MRKHWVLLVLLTLGFGTALILWLGGSPDKAPNPSTASTRIPGVQWHRGVAQRYLVKSDSSVGMEAAANPTSSIIIHLQCLLDIQTLDVASNDILVGMKLSGVVLKINQVANEEVSRSLGAPFRVHYNSAGLPMAFEFPAETTTQNRRMLESLVRMFQVSMETDSDTWVRQEKNANGSYDAVYRRIGPYQFDKSKRNFSAPSATMMSGTKISSTEHLQFDPAFDWIKDMNVDEELKTSNVNGPGMTIKNQARLELQIGIRPKLALNTWQFEAAVATIDDTVTTVSHPVPDISVEEARSRILKTVPDLNNATTGRLQLVHKLRDLLRVDDTLPGVLLDILRTQQLSDRTRADLYLVFEEAGTDSAQAALVSVFTDNNSTWSAMDAMRAIVAMGGIEHPNENSINALWNTAMNSVSDSNSQSIVSAATFALGSLGNTMKTSDKSSYDSLRSSLLNNAQDGVSDVQRSDFLLAIGNTQDSTLAQNIVGMLNDDAPSVRRATAESLGMLGVDQSADALVTRFQQEKNSRVRSTIAKSLESWSQPTASAMGVFRQDLRSEVDEMARYNVATFLGQNLSKYPENGIVLRDLLRNETSSRIRQKVADMLSASGQPLY